jgi:glucokinase
VRVAGIDLGGTKLAAAAFEEDGKVLHRESVSLSGKEGKEVGALIGDRLAFLAKEFRCTATGVCVPGLYRSAAGTVWAPNIPGWDDYPLREELKSRAGSRHRVTIDSDRAAYILGETWLGAARDCRDAIFLAVGTGIGAGILSGGRIVHGHGQLSGAIGWLALDRPFRKRFTQHGCFEDQASGPGLVRVAKDFMTLNTDYMGELRDKPGLQSRDVFNAEQAGDPIAAIVVHNAISLWGMAAANLVSLFNPEVIVFGGGVFGPALKFLDNIFDEATKWAQPLAMKQVRFVGSGLGNDAGLFGAARIAMLGGAH